MDSQDNKNATTEASTVAAATTQATAKPASYERYWDMAMGGHGEGKHIPTLFAWIVVGLISIVMFPLFRFSVKGRKTLQALHKEGGVVVICNHTSFLDVIFIYLSIWPKAWPRFIARDSLFYGKPWLLGWFLSRVGVIPIKRDSADRTSIKRATKFLKDGEVIVIMPEGTRRGKSNRVPELHGGAALIAKMGAAPILPMTVRNAENIKQPGKPIKFPKVTSEFGSPVSVAAFDFLPKEERLDGCIWYAMRQCFALSLNCPPDDVPMKELFPESPDYSEVFRNHPVEG